MDFVDWRKAAEEREAKPQDTVSKKPYQNSRFSDYIEELINEAQKRGEFDNLPGMGKPLALETAIAENENAMAYRLLQNNHLVPPEIDLLNEIDKALERVQAKATRLIHQSKHLHARRMPPFEREKRAFNATVEKTLQEYEQALCQINSKILTLNIMAPGTMHRPLLKVEQMVQELGKACPRFAV